MRLAVPERPDNDGRNLGALLAPIGATRLLSADLKFIAHGDTGDTLRVFLPFGTFAVANEKRMLFRR